MLQKAPLQRSFDELGTPLADVSFCIVDLETTGGSPATDSITEIGALTVRRGEVVGSFQTLVNPGTFVPAFIRLLTGITDDMLIEAPDIGSVLPTFLEFVKDTVFVAHNARFDAGFLNAALQRADYPPLPNRIVDTARLAAKILAGEVPNNRLQTLARFLRCAHQPCHRAYADVLATTDVLHHLIERATGFGVTTLEDLLALTSTRMDGTFSKIRLCDDVPSATGVYRFLGAQGQTLYVGKATDLRSRVRSYFYGDPRRQIRDLLRQTERIAVERFPTMLEAEVAEARAIAAELPPHNRAGKRKPTWYVKVSAKKPKVATARVVKDDGGVYVGPFSSRTARTLVEAFRDALNIHRCSTPSKCNGCAFSEMDRCSGGRSDRHQAEVMRAARSIEVDPAIVLDALATRMSLLARQGRFEEAAEVREKGSLLERTLCRSIEARALAAAGDVTLRIGESTVRFRDGHLISKDDDRPHQNEASVIGSWIRRHGDEARLVSVSGTWAIPITAAPSGRFVMIKR
jgi:DNA polymerase-3 subunit epsilon